MKDRKLLRSILRISLVLVIPIACVLLGYLVGRQLSGAGHLPSSPRGVPWRSLGTPVGKPVDILAADVSSVATISEDGSISYWSAASGWQEVDQMPTFRHTEASTGLVHDPPPGDVIVTHKSLVRDEAGVFTEFAVLADGSVWIWQYQQPGLGLLVAFVYGVAGSCVGLLVGLVLAWWGWRKTALSVPGQ